MEHSRLARALDELRGELRLQWSFSVNGVDPRVLRGEGRRCELLAALDSLREKLVQEASDAAGPVVEVPNVRVWSNMVFTDRVRLRPQPVLTRIRLDDPRSRDRFLLVLDVLEQARELLRRRRTMTPRELYYQLVDRAPSQDVVDAAILALAAAVPAPPWELGFLSTSKALVAGALCFTTTDGHRYDCSAGVSGSLLPPNVYDIVSVESPARFVLVVEKDAAFQKLLGEGLLARLGPCVLMTAKGYPDVATRLFLRRLWESLGIPVLVLVDADPYGIDIMCVYRFGSMKLAEHADALALPELRWLGVLPTDIGRLNIPSVPLTEDDRSKLRDLKTRPYMQHFPRILQEVQTLDQLGKKSEIEGLNTFSSSYLTDVYIPSRISSNDLV